MILRIYFGRLLVSYKTVGLNTLLGNIGALLELALISILLLMMVKKIPQIVNGVLSGNSSLGGADIASEIRSGLSKGLMVAGGVGKVAGMATAASAVAKAAPGGIGSKMSAFGGAAKDLVGNYMSQRNPFAQGYKGGLEMALSPQGGLLTSANKPYSVLDDKGNTKPVSKEEFIKAGVQARENMKAGKDGEAGSGGGGGGDKGGGRQGAPPAPSLHKPGDRDGKGQTIHNVQNIENNNIQNINDAHGGNGNGADSSSRVDAQNLALGANLTDSMGNGANGQDGASSSRKGDRGSDGAGGSQQDGRGGSTGAAAPRRMPYTEAPAPSPRAPREADRTPLRLCRPPQRPQRLQHPQRPQPPRPPRLPRPLRLAAPLGARSDRRP